MFERDLSERLGGIIERATNGQWQIKHAVRSNIPAKHLYAYARLSGTEHLFPDGSLPYLLEQLHTPEPQRTTQVHPVSYEDMQAYAQEFALLQAAIMHKHPCHFAYKSKARLVYPYKLIHQNGVWYLAAEEDGRLKNFSISLIQALQLDRTQQFAPSVNTRNTSMAKRMYGSLKTPQKCCCVLLRKLRTTFCGVRCCLTSSSDRTVMAPCWSAPM